MPDPRTLQIGDRVRFVHLPDEWKAPGQSVHAESVRFIEALIARGRSSRIAGIDDHGIPWFDARVPRDDGTMEHHSWGITESSGWRLVRPRVTR